MSKVLFELSDPVTAGRTVRAVLRVYVAKQVIQTTEQVEAFNPVTLCTAWLPHYTAVFATTSGHRQVVQMHFQLEKLSV
jgi:hypothetical protein